MSFKLLHERLRLEKTNNSLSESHYVDFFPHKQHFRHFMRQKIRPFLCPQPSPGGARAASDSSPGGKKNVRPSTNSRTRFVFEATDRSEINETPKKRNTENLNNVNLS